MQPAYSLEIEKQMQEVFDRLSEKDKRLYAGVEALKFPYGGISYIAQLFSCSRNTIPSAPGFFAKAEMGSIRFQRRKIFLAVIAFGGPRSSCSGRGAQLPFGTLYATGLRK